MAVDPLPAYYADQATPEAALGQRIYRVALSDRRGFSPGQIGIDVDDEVWLEIFEAIGSAALA